MMGFCEICKTWNFKWILFFFLERLCPGKNETIETISEGTNDEFSSDEFSDDEFDNATYENLNGISYFKVLKI